MTKKEFIIYFVNMSQKDWDKRFEGVEIDEYTNLYNANIRSADLEKVNLYDANLENANLENVDLRYANLENANLKYASIGSVIDKKKGRYDNQTN